MSTRIAFFDFDGTITTRDSFLEFIKYSKGSFAFYFGFALHSPVIAAFKLGLITNSDAKQIIMRHFFGKMSKEEFQQVADRFSEEVIPSLIRPKALKEIQTLQKSGTEIIIVSASAENWVKQWSTQIGAGWIATRLELIEDKITGKIAGANCFGEEKVRRIKEEFDLNNYREIYCYGDSPGDRPMLSLGTISFYKPFR